MEPSLLGAFDSSEDPVGNHMASVRLAELVHLEWPSPRS